MTLRLLAGYFFVLIVATIESTTALSSIPPPTTTSNPSASSSSSSIPETPSKALSVNQQALGDLPRFPRTWVPLASTLELDPDRPTPLQFLGQRYVTYRDNDDNWVVLDDACPHRLAPLSEGRVDRTDNALECSYHGWKFDKEGHCQTIPQADPALEDKFLKNPRCRVQSYAVVVEKGVLFAWLWPEDSLSVLSNPGAHPEHMMEGIQGETTTGYTRDLPYGWDTLLENFVDPSHIPFAHHGLQGKREDAIPINMTAPTSIGESGFNFTFDDRTLGLVRHGSCQFKAPYIVDYDGVYESKHSEKDDDKDDDTPPRVFKLSAVNIPTRPGWSRVMVFIGSGSSSDSEDDQSDQGETAVAEKKKKNKSPLTKIFQLLPVWLLHQFSNRFLDSDLAFLHFQEQEREKRKLQRPSGEVDTEHYFMPAQADRCVSAIRNWVHQYAHIPGPLPPPIDDRSVLFDRWAQHTDHCRHCQAAVKGIQKWRKRSFALLAVSLLLVKRLLAARLLAVASLLVLGALSSLEPSFKKGDFKHYENH